MCEYRIYRCYDLLRDVIRLSDSFFSARLSRYMLLPVCLCVCLSVIKRLKLGSCNFHRTVALFRLVFLRDKFHPEILTGSL